MGVSHERNIAGYIEKKALDDNVHVICTQEDPKGIVMKYFPEVVSACVGTAEANRIYVLASGIDHITADKRVFKLDRCPAALRMPARCVAIINVGSIRIANVFLPGGRSDDRVVLAVKESSKDEECMNDILKMRKRIVEDTVRAFEPDIIVGDWNADYRPGVDAAFYAKGAAGNHYATEGRVERHGLERWLKWRASPFRTLERHGYQFAWPSRPTTSRAELAVDGFAYNVATTKASDVYNSISFLQLSDHSAVICSFLVSPNTKTSIMSIPAKVDRHIYRSARSNTPARTQQKHPLSPPGLVFKASPVAFSADASITEVEESPLGAALHIHATGTSNREKGNVPRTAYTSWTTRLLLTLKYAQTNNHPFIWITCPYNYHDMRGFTRSEAVSKVLKDQPPQILYQNYRYDRNEAYHHNFVSGSYYDQVLIPRKSLNIDGVLSVEVSPLLEIEEVKSALNSPIHKTDITEPDILEKEWIVQTAVLKNLEENGQLKNFPLFRDDDGRSKK
jgi:hypothetical protein